MDAINRTASQPLHVQTTMTFAGSTDADRSSADVDPVRHLSRGQSGTTGQTLLLIGANSYQAITPTTFNNRVALLVHPALRWSLLTYEPAAHDTRPEQIGISPELIRALRSAHPDIRKKGQDYLIRMPHAPGTDRPGTYELRLHDGRVTNLMFETDSPPPSTISAVETAYSRFGETVTVTAPPAGSVIKLDQLQAETGSIDLTDGRTFCITLQRYIGKSQKLTCRDGRTYLDGNYKPELSFAAARAPFDALAKAAVEQLTGH
ncbi:MAG TPA: hypothetical protein VFH54_16925 [Mycobacteriales bacterium]|nr:hypothetical protein [Mycobacteriales bacterium]